MPIASPIGFLDVVNATLRASQVESTSRLTVANTAATKNFSVGDRFHIDKDSVDPVSVTGNVVASGIKISNLTISPIFDLGAVSNVGNTTSNTLQFANATTGFVTSSNVEIGGNITLTSNAQVKVGSNVLAEYTGPHGREPKEMPLKKFPEIAFDASKLDGNDTTNTYTQAGYTVTADSQITECKAYKAFDNKFFVNGSDLNRWQTSNNGYYVSTADTTTGPVTTLADSTTKRGSYIQLESPHKIIVSRYVIWAQENAHTFRPKKVILLGSNTGVTDWVSIDPAGEVEPEFVTTGAFPASTMATVSFTNTTAYKYHRLVVRATNGATVVLVQELELYGTEEPAPPGDLSLDTTLKSTFNSVRSNNYVMYFDGEGFIPGDNTSNNLVTGSSVSVIHHNATYDSTGKYWTLDGSTESNVTTGSLGFEGDVPHTVSMWVNASNLDANATTQQLFSIGSGYDKALVRVDDTQIAANTWHNVTYAYQGEGGSKVTYVDGRKVEEAQVEDTFGDYPPFAMTDYETGGYRVSASSEHTSGVYPPWKLFDTILTNPNVSFETIGDRYDTTGAPYEHTAGVSTTVSGTPYTGDWVQMYFPFKFKVDHIDLMPQDTYGLERMPQTAIIAGSDDNVNWTLLKSITTDDHALTKYTKYIVSATRAYKYIRFIWNTLTTAGSNAVYRGRIAGQEMRFYGHKEGDLTRFPEPTRVLEYPHIAVGVPQDNPAKRGYVVTTGTSIFSGRTGARAFDDQPTGDGWETDTSSYDLNNSGIAQTGTATFGAYTGHWVKLELPRKIIVSGIDINAYWNSNSQADDRRPDAGAFLGSNDDSSWELIHAFGSGTLSWSLSSGSSTTTYETNISSMSASNTNAYKYIVFVITHKTYGGSPTVTTDKTSIRRLRYFGTEEDTGTPAIVGGPFAGKVANFRVYDQYLGDERIQEIYDAQKDAFGHKKSSMTFYKGRIGVGTTEPEGALTVVDEPHALAKFPARAVSANDSYVEGDGQIKLSAADGSGYQAFDGLTSTSWTAAPTRNTRLSEEVDFGAWLKIQTPESVSLKKAEIESHPYWRQVGSTLEGGANNHQMGRSVASNKDGTRVAISRVFFTDTLSNQGLVQVYDWNGTSWVQVGNNIVGDTAGDRFGENDLELDDEGNTLIVGSKEDGSGSVGGQVDVYYLNGNNWTIKGNVFQGASSTAEMGSGVSISADGNTIAFSEMGYDNLSPVVADSGRVRVFTWSGSTWVQKGNDIIGAAGEKIGTTVNMTPDGNYIITGNHDVSSGNGKVWVYAWDGSAWQLRYSQTGTGTDYLGYDTSISDDGNVIAIGEYTNDDYATDHGAVHIRRWNGSTYALDQTLFAPFGSENAAGDYFGSGCKLSGDGTRLIAGSRYVPGTGNDSKGRLFTFEYDGSSWIRRGGTSDLSYGTEGNQGTTGTGSNIGWQNTFAISRDGSVIVVGMPNDDSFYSDGGAAKVFSMPSNIKSIWGSNDDVNWTKITTGNKTFRVDDRLEFKNLDNPNYYKYHAIVADAFTRLKDVKLFGVRKQGSSTLHDGTLTLTKNLDVPRIGPALDADDTPRRDRLVVEYNTSTNPVEDGVVRDTSGRGLDGVLYGGAYYDATEKAFRFDGVNDSIKSGNIGFSGAQPLTVSLWFRYDDIPTTREDIFDIGKAATATRFGLATYTPGTYLFTGGNDIYNTGYNPVTDTLWHHIVAIYRGGIPNTTTMSLYLDNVDVTGNLNYSTASQLVNFDSINSTATLGANSGGSPTDGFISNFKLYDVALTAEEVKTLYDMGRCDEGRHVVNFSKTQVGIGLGDGKVPEAQLDVRGDVILRSRVGIGTTNPIAPFHVYPINGTMDFENTFIDFRHEFPPHGHLGIFATETHTNSVGPDLRFKGSVYNGTSNPTINQVMCLKPTGNIGIGTTTPYAMLHVYGARGTFNTVNPSTGQHDRTASYMIYDSSTIYLAQTGSFYGISIYGNADILSGSYIGSFGGYITASDSRIKKEIVDVEDGSALETLRLLKPKRYKYKDEVKRGSEPVWGFIAQEVRDTLPYATQLRTECLPNIYETANVSDSNVITFTNFNTSNLESNAMVLKVFDKDDTEHLVNIAEIVDDHSVRVEEDLSEWTGSVDESGNVVAGNQLFVYGQRVDDFVFLRKESIWTVATSALQEVDRQLQAEKAKVASLETQLTSVLARLDALEGA